MLPRLDRLRRAVAVLCLLPAPLLAQDAPSSPWQIMLDFHPVLRNVEPGLRLPFIDIAFTPVDGGNATVVVKRDGKEESSILCSLTQRVGNMHRYQPRRPFATLEAVEGERVVELQLGGRVVGPTRVTFRKLANIDPFGTTAGWVATGPWADDGYFTRPVAPTEQQRVSFTFWASTLELNGAPKAMVDLVVLRGRTVIARTAQREVSSADWLPKREPPHFLSPRTISERGASLNPLTFAWVTR